MTLKHLLAATDFSPCSNHAVRRAALLVAESGGRLSIVHALPGAALTWQLLRLSGTDVESSLRKSVHTLLTELSDEIKSRLNIEVDYHIGTGAAHRVIGDAVETHQPDLLVIGAHGEGIMQQLFLGGTAGKLLTHSTRPVLVVRLAADAPYQTAIAAIDLGPRTQSVLDTTRALAPKAACHVVYAFVAPFEGQMRLSGASEESLKHYRAEERCKAEQRLTAVVPDASAKSRIVHDGHPTSVLLEQISTHHAELIVAARHSGTRFSDTVMGSVPRFLAFHAACDVLVV